MKQPEALRLAAALNSESEKVSAGVKYSTARQSSKELVRLHETSQAMLEALKKFSEYESAMDAGNDIDGMLLYAELQAMSRAAIAKGEEK